MTRWRVRLREKVLVELLVLKLALLLEQTHKPHIAYFQTNVVLSHCVEYKLHVSDFDELETSVFDHPDLVVTGVVQLVNKSKRVLDRKIYINYVIFRKFEQLEDNRKQLNQ